jgi:carbonic anhydrase/acetyltransferase-like protein (isoleucine patch superfamily)/aryl carrier-like protein
VLASSYIRWLSYAFGTIPLDVRQPETLESAVSAGRRYLSDGVCVAFFPESVCGPQGELGRFHASLFEMVSTSEVAVLPVALEYQPRGTFPDWSGNESLARNVLRVLGCGQPLCVRLVEAELVQPRADQARVELADVARARIGNTLGLRPTTTRPFGAASSLSGTIPAAAVQAGLVAAIQSNEDFVLPADLDPTDALEQIGFDSLRLVELCVELETRGCDHRILSSLTVDSTIETAVRVVSQARARADRQGSDPLSAPKPAIPSGWLTRSHRWLATPARAGLAMLAVAIWAAAGAETAWCASFIWIHFGLIAAAAAAPILLCTTFALTAGLLSVPFAWSIQPITVRASLDVPLYVARRGYGMCWTSLYYFKACYALVLAIPWLKWVVFRLFGYRGSMKFTTYPDTWIRDLPLLHFEDGVYLSNRATLGTNVLPGDGTIIVGPIRLGTGALVGHLAVIGLNSHLADDVSIGVGSQVGIGVRMGRGVRVGPSARVNHYATIGAGVHIAANEYVDKFANLPAIVGGGD